MRVHAALQFPVRPTRIPHALRTTTRRPNRRCGGGGGRTHRVTMHTPGGFEDAQVAWDGHRFAAHAQLVEPLKHREGDVRCDVFVVRGSQRPGVGGTQEELVELLIPCVALGAPEVKGVQRVLPCRTRNPNTFQSSTHAPTPVSIRARHAPAPREQEKGENERVPTVLQEREAPVLDRFRAQCGNVIFVPAGYTSAAHRKMKDALTCQPVAPTTLSDAIRGEAQQHPLHSGPSMYHPSKADACTEPAKKPRSRTDIQTCAASFVMHLHHSLVRRDGCKIPRFPALATMSMEVRMCFIITRSAQQSTQRRAEMWAIVAPHEGLVFAALDARRVFPRHTLLSDEALEQSSTSSKCPMPVRLPSRPLARRLLQNVARHSRGPHFLRLEIRKILRLDSSVHIQTIQNPPATGTARKGLGVPLPHHLPHQRA